MTQLQLCESRQDWNTAIAVSRSNSSKKTILRWENNYYLPSSCIEFIDYDSRFSAAGRLEHIRNHPAVAGWPMYKDGDQHHLSRSINLKIIQSLVQTHRSSVIPFNGNLNYINVVEYLVKHYSKAIGIDLKTFFDNWAVIQELHESVLFRDASVLDETWKEVGNYSDLSDLFLSALIFQLVDSSHSITHLAILGYLLQSKNRKSLTKADILRVGQEKPPFSFLTRTLISPLEISGVYLPKNAKILWDIKDNPIGERPIFGIGTHSCPGRSVAIALVLDIVNMADAELGKTPISSQAAGELLYTDLE